MAKFRFDPCPSCCEECKVFDCACVDLEFYKCAEEGLVDPFLGQLTISGVQILRGAGFTGATPFDIINGTYGVLNTSCVTSRTHGATGAVGEYFRQFVSNLGLVIPGPIADSGRPDRWWWDAELNIYVVVARLPSRHYRYLRASWVLGWGVHAMDPAQGGDYDYGGPVGVPGFESALSFTFEDAATSAKFSCDHEYPLANALIFEPPPAPEPNTYSVDCSAVAMTFSVASE